MPETPEVGIFTRYVLESAWIPSTILLVAGVAFLWFGLRDGVKQRLVTGGVLTGLAAIIFTIGSLVTTSGEHAARVTRQFVDDVANGRTRAALNAVGPDGGLSIGSPNNPRFDRDFLADRIAWQGRTWPIESNTITNFDSFTVDDETGEVQLACYTDVMGFPAPTLTGWVVTVRRQQDGTWMIDQLTFVSLNGQPATEGVMR